MGAVKKILGFILAKPQGQLRNSHRGQKHTFEGMKPSEIFDLVYQKGLWGKDSQGRSISGSGSYENHLKDPYIRAIRGILRKHNLKVIC